MVQKIMAQGVIQNSNGPWASPVVLIKKKDSIVIIFAWTIDG